MERFITLVRHAEAVDGLSNVKDFDRELTDQGFIALIKLGKFLKQQVIDFDMMLCSTAKRTCQTIELLAEQLFLDKDAISYEDRLYNQSLGDFIQQVQSLPEEHKEVLIVGHNPTLSYFTELVANQTGYMLPTCAAVRLKFEAASWMLVDAETAEIEWDTLSL